MSSNRNNYDSIQGQVAIVTGGGSGLGRAFALALASAGAIVTVTGRSPAQLTETVTQISAAGGRALAITADVTDQDAIIQLITAVEHQFGSVDLLINNAGIISPIGPLWQIIPNEWWRSVEINLRGVLHATHAVLPGMIAQQRGRIINVASAAGIRPTPYASAYATSKAAVIRLTETLASETHDYGINIFAIHPGTVRTAMTEYLLESSIGQRWMPWVQATFEEGRDVSVERVVQLILQLASGHGDVLSGRFITITDDLDKMVQQVDEIEAGGLYTLRVHTLEKGNEGR